MSPRSKLCIANALMLTGIAPLLLGIGWICWVIAYARQHKGQMGGSDAFLMMAVLFLTYAFALIIGGASALWSTFLTKRNVGLRSRVATTIRWSVCIVLLVPVVWYVGLML